MKFFTLLFALFYMSTSLAEESIVIRGPQSQYDASHNYYEGLVKLAFKKKGLLVNIKHAPFMVQNRALSELSANRILDLYWAGSDASREASLNTVKIPLVKGLLGFRVFLTHQENVHKLQKINNVDDLYGVSLCQGSHWPDTDIMLAAGLNVMPNPIYESMFSQVNIKRCDAFPRGINEALSEFNIRKASMPNLSLFQDLILYYPFPMYFFTAKENTKLQKILTEGLELAIDDGSFDNYIKTHPTTKHLFPITSWNNAKIIKLNNPFLTKNTDVNNSRYWITPK